MSYTYKAFISYRHKTLDSSVAVKVQRTIERYTVPKDLRDLTGGKKIGKVFRDEDELPLSSSLSDSIVHALDNSEFLIVICTPDLPLSKWCEQEIRHFLSTHDRDHVITVLASGSSDESFSPLLLHTYDEEGNILEYTANPTMEQSAALNNVLEYLKDENNTFEYAAYQFSDDTGSKENGGYIGAINEENAANYDEMFAKAAMALNDDEVSNVVVSQFGYHIIKNAGSTVEKALNDYYFLSSLENSYPDLALKAILKKGSELGFEIKDEKLLNSISSQLESEEN